jgi:hypothetical protein
MSIKDETARVNDLIAKWKAFRSSIGEPERYCQIKGDLYKVRNAGWQSNPPISVWPVHLIDPDDGVMAAVEHYFLCRCWVGNGIYPAWQVRAMGMIYDLGKMAGVTPQHNPTKPTTPPTAVQMACKEAGIRDGEKDLAASGKEAPLVTKPPVYY